MRRPLTHSPVPRFPSGAMMFQFGYWTMPVGRIRLNNNIARWKKAEAVLAALRGK